MVNVHVLRSISTFYWENSHKYYVCTSRFTIHTKRTYNTVSRSLLIVQKCRKSRPHRDFFFRSPDRPTRSESLYRLSYPGPCPVGRGISKYTGLVKLLCVYSSSWKERSEHVAWMGDMTEPHQSGTDHIEDIHTRRRIILKRFLQSRV
jgi:hypothetical protein